MMWTRRDFLRFSLLTGVVVLTGCRSKTAPTPSPTASVAQGGVQTPTPATAPGLEQTIHWPGDERISQWLAAAKTEPSPDYTPTLKVPRIVEVATEVETEVAVPLQGAADRYVRQLMLYDPESLVKIKLLATFSPLVSQVDVSTMIKMLRTSRLAAIVKNNADESWWGQSEVVQVGEGGCAVGDEPPRTLPDDVLRVKFRDAGDMVRMQVRLHHPMLSGLAIDDAGNVIKVYDPFYIERLTVTYGNDMVADFELTPGLSENARLSFLMPRLGSDPVTVTVVNNEGDEFSLKALIPS